MEDEFFFDEKKLKIKSKLKKTENTNKTAFIIGPNFLLSNTNTHNNETNKKMKLEEGIIEIKKECIYEKDVRSKVLKMNAKSPNSEKTEEMLTELKMDGMKNASYSHTTSEERLAAMHCNEMQNAKARYRALFDARKKQLTKIKDETMSVEQVIRNVKVNGDNLFLGIQQGSRKHSKDVQVVTNPSRKRQAISWILHDHKTLEISDIFQHKTSIKKEESDETNATKSQEELREFLWPVL